MAKNWNSVAILAFSVEHDDKEHITEEEFRAALLRRVTELLNETDGLEQACGSDFFDTVDNFDESSYPEFLKPQAI